MRPHISLDVRDVDASVEFYRRMFGVLPQKQTAHYAKFDLTSPPLNLSMVSSSGEVSAVNHFGIEVDSVEEIALWEGRLHEQGLVEAVEKNVECCYARQDKIWVKDPDGNKWEVFTVLEQLPLSTPLKENSCCLPANPTASATAACSCS